MSSVGSSEPLEQLPKSHRNKVCLEGNSIRVAHYSDPEGAEELPKDASTSAL